MHHVHRSAMAALAAFVLFLCPAKSASGQSRAVSLEDMVRASSAVITGRTVNQESFWDDSGRRIVTRVRVAVDNVVVGDAARETELLVPGGRVGNTVQEISDMPVFVDGEEVLVFVWTTPDGRNLVTGGMQGKLDVIRGDAGQKMIRGMGPLMREDLPAELAPEQPGPEGRGRTRDTLPLDTVLDRIKAARN